jgi:hypothetical protein
LPLACRVQEPADVPHQVRLVDQPDHQVAMRVIDAEHGYRRAFSRPHAAINVIANPIPSPERPRGPMDRTRFVADVLTSALAPTNVLVGNPAALKKAFDTAGLSLLRGTRNLLRDIRNNGAMPATALLR